MAIKVPVIKNGAKGTSLFKPFLPENIIINPIIAPIKNAKNSPTNIIGKPKISPNNIANLTSPNPIQAPLETRYIIKKNKDPKIAPNK